MAENKNEVLKKIKEIHREIEQLVTDSYNIGRRDEREEKDKSENRPQIEVGVIVRGDFYDGVVTKMDNMYGDAFVLWSDGETSTETFEWINKHLTGRKIKGLNGILDEINGDE